MNLGASQMETHCSRRCFKTWFGKETNMYYVNLYTLGTLTTGNSPEFSQRSPEAGTFNPVSKKGSRDSGRSLKSAYPQPRHFCTTWCSRAAPSSRSIMWATNGSQRCNFRFSSSHIKKLKKIGEINFLNICDLMQYIYNITIAMCYQYKNYNEIFHITFFILSLQNLVYILH